MLERLIFNIPILGWLLKEAAHGPASVKTMFLINVKMLWLLAILIFGYPAIIIPALILVPTMFVVLFIITKG
jgi:hypothetical protein